MGNFRGRCRICVSHFVPGAAAAIGSFFVRGYIGERTAVENEEERLGERLPRGSNRCSSVSAASLSNPFPWRSAIASYFDFGLQTIFGRFVAKAAERGEDETLSKLASTSMMLLAVASLVPLAACGLFLPFLSVVFHSSSIVVLHEIQR